MPHASRNNPPFAARRRHWWLIWRGFTGHELRVLLLILVVTIPAVVAVGRILGASASRSQDSAPSGPIPFGEEAIAGPLALTIVEVVAGFQAVEQVLAADQRNEPPREGITYLLIGVVARNTGDRSLLLDPGDFALIGNFGVPRRFLDTTPPGPALAGALPPGDRRQGWLVFAAPADETPTVLLYDSLSLEGSWADVRLGLAADPGLSLPTPAPPSPNPNAIGRDPAAPAVANEPITTADWEIELLEVVTGAEVFALVDYRSGALGESDAIGDDVDGSVWVALRFRLAAIAGRSPTPFLPANAFAVVDATGQPLPDLITLTPPRPDASGAYEPGATRDGWVAFDLPRDLGATTVRFLPFAATTAEPDPRFVDFS